MNTSTFHCFHALYHFNHILCVDVCEHATGNLSIERHSKRAVAVFVRAVAGQLKVVYVFMCLCV